MTKKIEFKYFLNGTKVNKSDIDWESNHTVKIEHDKVYVTTTGHLSTRHKHPPGGYNNQ